MESVEVWMWVIAGLVLGGLVFVGGFKLMSSYVHSTEVAQAEKGINTLYTMVTNVCFGGRSAMEVRNIVFPPLVEKVYVKDKFGVEGFGKNLCYELEKEEEFCLDLKACNVTMDTLRTKRKKGIFQAMQRFLGRKRFISVRFSLNKMDYSTVGINWSHTVITSG